MKALPTVPVTLVGSSSPVYALVDTGCSQSLISSSLLRDTNSNQMTSTGKLLTVDGSLVECGSAMIRMVVGGRPIGVQCLVIETLVAPFDLILGMDVIRRLGGLRVLCGGGEEVQFGLAASGVTDASASNEETQLVVEDADFSASFDGTK